MRHFFSGSLIAAAVAITLVTFVAGSANAVVIASMATSSPTTGLVVGDEIVIDFFVNNPDGDAVNSIFSSIIFDQNVIALTNTLGLPSILDDPADPFSSAIGLVIAPEQKLLEAPGIFIGLAYGGVIAATGPGGLAMRLTFTVVGGGAFDFFHGLQGTDESLINGNLNVIGNSPDLAFTGSPISISAIPEPGTALLMGLGLLGLAGAGRRKA